MACTGEGGIVPAIVMALETVLCEEDPPAHRTCGRVYTQAYIPAHSHARFTHVPARLKRLRYVALGATRGGSSVVTQHTSDLLCC